jgi:hypothetical protein
MMSVSITSTNQQLNFAAGTGTVSGTRVGGIDVNVKVNDGSPSPATLDTGTWTKDITFPPGATSVKVTASAPGGQRGVVATFTPPPPVITPPNLPVGDGA